MPSSSFKPGNERLKEAILIILSNTNNLQAMGMKKLAKLLYFADFNHYEETQESVTSETYERFDHGPMPSSLYDAIEQLESEGYVTAERQCIAEGVEKWSFDLEEEEELGYLDSEHKKRIMETLEKLDDMSANELEDLSHRDTPWQVTDDREDIKYKLVFYRDEDIDEFFD